MPRFATPDHEGFFWGKLVHSNSSRHVEFNEWEAAQVFYNDEICTLAVWVLGCEAAQEIDAFVWGPEIVMPTEISNP